MRRIAAGVLLACGATVLAQPEIDRLPMNQIQVLGSHNSYKQAIEPALLSLLKKNDPQKYASLEYAHETLAAQLTRGLRKLGLRWLREAGQTPAPYDPAGVMRQPGFKVLHVPDIDFRSHTFTFREALQQLRTWSDAHPRHLPILVMMNAKDVGIEAAGAVKPLSFDAGAFAAWDAEIRDVLPAGKLLTPDLVRGAYPSLEAAVRAHAWPPLGKVRGRFLFVLDETGAKLETYVQGHPSLGGRVMFVNATEGRPEAAFRVVNDPIASFHYIQQLVRAGYLVRTRADADTVEARRNDRSRLQAAFASGAQFVSTDYYRPDEQLGTGFQVALPGGGVGRWNPVLTPPFEHLPPPE